jgi:hypothetical protein
MSTFQLNDKLLEAESMPCAFLGTRLVPGFELLLARQVLYHLNHALALFCLFLVIVQIGS